MHCFQIASHVITQRLALIALISIIQLERLVYYAAIRSHFVLYAMKPLIAIIVIHFILFKMEHVKHVTYIFLIVLHAIKQYLV